MAALERITTRIPDFPGYESAETRPKADEEVRAYAGERLAAVPADRLDALGVDDRARYDRLLLRSEFLNPMAFHDFQENASTARIAGTLQADLAVLDAADSLQAGDLAKALVALEAAYECRDAAMTAQ